MAGTTMAQDYSQLFAGFGPYLRAASPMRDPRTNRGEDVALNPEIKCLPFF